MFYPPMQENKILMTKRLTSDYKPTRILFCLRIVTIQWRNNLSMLWNRVAFHLIHQASIKEKHVAENSSPKMRNSVDWQGYKIDVPVKSIQMQEDYWKDVNSWICCSCSTTLRLEIAFHNHLRRQEDCNKKYVCMTCNNLVYLLDLKSHMSNNPKCVGGKAILQSHYSEVLTKT